MQHKKKKRLPIDKSKIPNFNLVLKTNHWSSRSVRKLKHRVFKLYNFYRNQQRLNLHLALNWKPTALKIVIKSWNLITGCGKVIKVLLLTPFVALITKKKIFFLS